MAIKCVKNPSILGNQLATRFVRAAKYPLNSIDELKGVSLDFLIRSQESLADKDPSTSMDVKDFLTKFKQHFDSGLKILISKEKNISRRDVLTDALAIDWNEEVKNNATPYFTAGKVDPLTTEENKNLKPTDEFEQVEDLDEVIVSDTKSEVDKILEARSYSDLLINLVEVALEKSDNVDVKSLNASQLASDFDKFLKYQMYSVMVDTRAEGTNLGFIRDKDILTKKLKIKMKAISESENAEEITIEDIIPYSEEAGGFPTNTATTTVGKHVFFGKLADTYSNEIATKIFATEEFSWTQSWDTTNANSDIYLDTISKLIFTNSPRLIAKEGLEGEFMIDYDSPVLTESEIKNIVLPTLAVVRNNSLEGIREELAKHTNNPVINSIYTYYFNNSNEGYLVTDILGETTKHYSYGHAVDQALEEEFGVTKVEPEERKYKGFSTAESDAFKNRIISDFISIEKSDRGYTKDGRLELTSDKSFGVQQGYKATLVENMSTDSYTKKNIAKEITLTPVFQKVGLKHNGRIAITISKTNEKGYSNSIVDFQVDLKETKSEKFNIDSLTGLLGNIVPGTLNLNGNEYNLINALTTLGFQWAKNPKFIKEYSTALNSSGKHNLSLENLLANLAVSASLNSIKLQKDTFNIVKGLKGTRSYKETNNINDESLHYDPSVYLNQFFDKGGPVTEAINSIHNFASSVEFITQENTRAASTVGVTPDSRKNIAVLDARDLIKKGAHTVLEGNEIVTEDLELIGSYVKEGIEVNGNILLLKDMAPEDRTISLIEQGLSALAFMDGTNSRSIILQAHQYADKTSPKVHIIKSKKNLITIKNKRLDAAPLILKIIKNNKRKYNNLSRSLHDQWKKVLVSDWNKTMYFINPSKDFIKTLPKRVDEAGIDMTTESSSIGLHIKNLLESPDADLNSLNNLLRSLNIDTKYITKNTNLVNGLAFDIKKDKESIPYISIKNTSIQLQRIFNNTADAKKLINYHNDNFINRLFSKLGENTKVIHDDIKSKLAEDLGIKTISDKEAAKLYHLLHQYIAPQIEELSIGDSSQFKGDFDINEEVDFENEEFASEKVFEFQKLIKQIDKGQSTQNGNKSKRSSLLLTNGHRLAILERGKFGLGVDRYFNTAVLEDTELQKRILTGIKRFENYDGIRIGLDLVRRQINAAIGEGSLISKGEAHKDGYMGFDPVTGAYRIQKMSTMYMTPEFINNSDLANTLIKRMLTAIPYSVGTSVMLYGDTESTPVDNAWDVLMKLEEANNLSLSDDLLWDYFQKTEAINPLIRGKYISYLTFNSAEKTGSTGMDTTDGFGFSKEVVDKDGNEIETVSEEYDKGDMIQWRLEGQGNRMESGTVIKAEPGVVTIVQELNTGEYLSRKILTDKHGDLYIDTEEGFYKLKDFYKSFNYSTLDYNNHSIILKAGKDSEYKGGVAKMIQAFNSVLFNNSYVKDALNTIQAQGNIAKSNINKLKEDIVIRTMEKVLESDQIAGVSAKELIDIKYILTNLPNESQITYNADEARINKFLNNSNVQLLGLKNFIVDQSRDNNIDLELYKKMLDPNYNFSFSGSSTNLMVKTFSTYIERQTIKNRYSGGMMILSPAEDFLRLYDYDGQALLRKDLIYAMKDENDYYSVDKLSKSKFTDLYLEKNDIVELVGGRTLTIEEYVDSKLNGDNDLLYESLRDNFSNVYSMEDLSTRKLKHSQIKSSEGLIEDSNDYKTFVKFQDSDPTRQLDEDEFKVYKFIANSTDRGEYDFFRQFDTYKDYTAAYPNLEIELNYGLINTLSIANFKSHIDRNKIIIKGKARLNVPINIVVYNKDKDFDINTFLKESPEFQEVLEYAKENKLNLDNEIIFEVTDDTKKSDTHATQQENVINKITLIDHMAILSGLDNTTPFKVAKNNLIQELRSTVDGGPKYTTTDGEMIIPFIYAKEFGFKKDIPPINKILGYAKTETEALKNAKKFFKFDSSAGYIAFNTFNPNKTDKLSGETDEDHNKRALLDYKSSLILDKAKTSAISGPLFTQKEKLIDELISKVSKIENLEGKDFLDNIDLFDISTLRSVGNSSYAKFVKEARAESFIKYLKVYYGRIPGTGLQTNGAGNTIGFIQDMGNTAFVDSLNVLITGSDFDIDKITMIVPAIDNNGIAYSYDEWKDDSSINDITTELLKNPEEISADNIQLMTKSIDSEDFNKKLSNYILTLEKNLLAQNKISDNKLSMHEVRVELNNAKRNYREQFEKGMQNYILDQMRTITKGVDVQFEAQTMVHMNNITAAKENLLNKKLKFSVSPEAQAFNMKSLSSFDLFGSMKLETENFAGKRSVGPFANAQKSLALILNNINLLKQKAIQAGQSTEDIGKFKSPISLILQRDEDVIRSSSTFANLEDAREVSGHEDATLRRLINEFRSLPENKNASILDISTYLISETFDETIDVKKAWEDKLKMLTRNQGWEEIGEFIQSATDNAKVLNLGPVGANQHTNSYFAFALISGFNISDTVEFLSNDKIKAISAIYDNFSKKVHTNLDLKVYFGNAANIPQEFKSIFKLYNKNTVIKQWPDKTNLKLSIASLNEALIREAKDNKELYKSFAQIIEGEEELRILSSFIGLDGKHPNSLFDTINKFRAIGNNISTVLNRGKHLSDGNLRRLFEEHRDDIKSPATLAYKYSTDDSFKQSIDQLLKVNIKYINGLDIISNNQSFDTYVKNLGYKLQISGQLSYTPFVYLDSKFSGWLQPTYNEHRRLERVVHGLSVRTYLEKRDYAKQVKLLSSDTTYDLTKDEDLKEFLINFKDDVELIKQQNVSNAFINFLKLDTDRTKDADTPKNNKYYNLYIGNNATEDELNYIKAALKELSSPTASIEEQQFYKNLQLYSLIVDSGLIQKNGIFQFMSLDMKDYNDHLETILLDSNTKERLTGMSAISVKLNAPHLMDKVDTAEGFGIGSVDDNINDMIDYQNEIDNIDDGQQNRQKSIHGDKELNINQDKDIYKSTYSGRVYYNTGPILGHVIVSPKNSSLGTLSKYDNSIDEVLDAGWQYGLPLKLKDKSIYVLKAIDDNSYYYIENQNFLNTKYEGLNLTEEQTLLYDGQVKIISAQELLINNPDWIFRKNNIRRQYTNERFETKFQPVKTNFTLENRKDGIKIGTVTPDIGKLADTETQERFAMDELILLKSNKALIKSADLNGMQLYNSVINTTILNQNKFVENDVVTILIEGNLIPNYTKIDKVIKSGAVILTQQKSSRNSKTSKFFGNSKSSMKGERRLAQHLSKNNYIEIQPGIWSKKITEKPSKESRILLPNDYKVQSKYASKKVLTSLVHKISSLFPNSQIEMLSTNEISLDPDLGNAYTSAKGFVKEGIVYFNTDKMTLDTPIHEFGHLYIETIRQNDLDLYNQIMQESLKHELVGDVKAVYPELEGIDLAEEVFVTALGLNTQSIITTSPLNKFIQDVIAWWKNVMSQVFNIPNKKAGEITLNDSINTIIDKLGQKMVFESDVLSDISTEEHQMIAVGRKETMSYTLIENNLIEQGFIKKICTF